MSPRLFCANLLCELFRNHNEINAVIKVYSMFVLQKAFIYSSAFYNFSEFLLPISEGLNWKTETPAGIADVFCTESETASA